MLCWQLVATCSHTTCWAPDVAIEGGKDDECCPGSTVWIFEQYLGAWLEHLDGLFDWEEGSSNAQEVTLTLLLSLA